ncbi:MAG TPA: hypothetical protein VGH14_09045 [Solirubrobacterales bacterium]|jgi:hypothetical protein
MIACVIAIVGGVAYEQVRDRDEAPAHPSITEHKGTLHWTPRGPNPAPDLSQHYWTWSYPAAYSSRVHKGVGVYFRDERIGFVAAKRVDRGTVWVYAWIAPEFQPLALKAVESEPIETKEGPRIQIYRVSHARPAENDAA